MVKDEMSVLASLDHPNVIGFYDSFESRYNFFFILKKIGTITKFYYKIEINFILFLNCKRVFVLSFFFSKLTFYILVLQVVNYLIVYLKEESFQKKMQFK